MRKRMTAAALVAASLTIGVGSAIAQSGGGPGGTSERSPVAEPKAGSAPSASPAKKQKKAAKKKAPKAY